MAAQHAAIPAMLLGQRCQRRLGVKRLRIELERLHGLRLAASTIHKVLTRLNLSALPRKRRPRHVPKRYSRPVPGDRVQMDTCKICPGLWQFAAVDDCSRYLVAGLAKRRSAAATLTSLMKSCVSSPPARGKKLGRQFGQRPKLDRLAPKIMALVKQGRSYRLIGREVGLSKNTVVDIVKRNRAVSARSSGQ